jgi:hypothetical protein
MSKERLKREFEVDWLHAGVQQLLDCVGLGDIWWIVKCHRRPKRVGAVPVLRSVECDAAVLSPRLGAVRSLRLQCKAS